MVKLVLENVGIFKNRIEIELRPLTVIAGENDTGKSTIGKVLFVLLKALFMSQGGYFYKSWKNYIRTKVGDLKRELQSLPMDNTTYNTVYQRLERFLEKAIFILEDRSKKYDWKREKIRKEIEGLSEFVKNKLNNQNFLFLFPTFESLLRSTEQTFREDHKKLTLQSLLGYQFFGEAVSKESSSKEATIRLEYTSGKLEAKIFNHKVEKLQLEGTLPFKDITFVDTPVIFQLIKFLSEEEVIRLDYTPTIKDLRRKLHDREFSLTLWEKQEIEPLESKLKKIVNAEIVQEKDGNFYMLRHTLRIRLENAATGIKSFAIPMILLRKGWIRRNTVLILDEPEVHLHPIWQVKYAELIIELVKKGIWVITTTHSPYIVQAFEKFINENNLKERSSFYLLSRQKETVKCESVIDSLEKIYRLFVKPVEEILP